MGVLLGGTVSLSLAHLLQAGGMGKLLLDVHEKYGHVVRLIFGGEVYVSIDNPEVRMAW